MRGIVALILVIIVIGVIFGFIAVYGEIERLKSMVGERDKVISSLTSQVSSLQIWLDANKTYYMGLVDSLVAERDKLREEYSSLQRMYSDVSDAYMKLRNEYDRLNQLLSSINSTYRELLKEYCELSEKYRVLSSVGLVFNGLKITDLRVVDTSLFHTVKGNITNVSDKPMKRVYIFLLTFDKDGMLEGYSIYTVENLAVNETNSFEFPYSLEEDELFRVFAIGSYSFTDIENSRIVELLADIDKLNTRIEELEGMLTLKLYVLTDREYYNSILYDLRRANNTILISMYEMVYDPYDTFDWANDLIRELVDARRRGVNVTVIIEYRTYRGYMDENMEAYRYLSENGVKVILDNDTETDHMKIVVIDSYIVYVGSHNWSESGLYYNREVSIKIVSRDVASLLERYIETIP